MLLPKRKRRGSSNRKSLPHDSSKSDLSSNNSSMKRRSLNLKQVSDPILDLENKKSISWGNKMVQVYNPDIKKSSLSSPWVKKGILKTSRKSIPLQLEKFQQFKRMSQIAITRTYEEPIVVNDSVPPTPEKSVPRKSGEIITQMIKQFNESSSGRTSKIQAMDTTMA